MDMKKSRIARRGIDTSERLGKHCWVVERTHVWLTGFGKLRWSRETAEYPLGAAELAAAIIFARFVGG